MVDLLVGQLREHGQAEARRAGLLRYGQAAGSIAERGIARLAVHRTRVDNFSADPVLLKVGAQIVTATSSDWKVRFPSFDSLFSFLFSRNTLLSTMKTMLTSMQRMN